MLSYFSEKSSARHPMKTTLQGDHSDTSRDPFTNGTLYSACSILSSSFSALLKCIRSHFSHVTRSDPVLKKILEKERIHEHVNS